MNGTAERLVVAAPHNVLRNDDQDCSFAEAVAYHPS